MYAYLCGENMVRNLCLRKNSTQQHALAWGGKASTAQQAVWVTSKFIKFCEYTFVLILDIKQFAYYCLSFGIIFLYYIVENSFSKNKVYSIHFKQYSDLF